MYTNEIHQRNISYTFYNILKKCCAPDISKHHRNSNKVSIKELFTWAARLLAIVPDKCKTFEDVGRNVSDDFKSTGCIYNSYIAVDAILIFARI